jgi:hypothetical protein
MEHPKIISALITVVQKDPAVHVRIQAACVLRERGDTQAIAALLRAYHADRGESPDGHTVRDLANQALGAITERHLAACKPTTPNPWGYQTQLLQSTFSLLDWNSLRNQLLLRTRRNLATPEETNLDILFWGVFYVDLPYRLCGIEITYPSPQEVERLRARLPQPFPEGDLFVLCSQEQRFYVMARSYLIYEHPGADHIRLS